MYNSEKNFGILTVSGKEFYIHMVTKTGSQTDFKLKYKKEGSLHTATGKGGQTANRIHRLGVEKRDVILISEKLVAYFMTNNNTVSLVDEVVSAGPGLLKKDVCEYPLVKQYFPNTLTGTIEDQHLETGEKLFKDFQNIMPKKIRSFL